MFPKHESWSLTYAALEFKRNSDAKLKVIKIQSENNVREEKIAGGEAKQERQIRTFGMVEGVKAEVIFLVGNLRTNVV